VVPRRGRSGVTLRDGLVDGIRLLARSREEAIVALKWVPVLTGMPGSYCTCCHAMQS
jgi:hypothetical protein